MSNTLSNCPSHQPQDSVLHVACVCMFLVFACCFCLHVDCVCMLIVFACCLCLHVGVARARASGSQGVLYWSVC